jgi:hypothetical protein
MRIKNVSSHMIANLAPGESREIPRDMEDRVRKSAAFRAGHLKEGDPPMPMVEYRPLPTGDGDAKTKAMGLVSMETDPSVLARWAQDTEDKDVRNAIHARQVTLTSTPRTSTNEGPAVVPQSRPDSPGMGAPVPPPPPPPPPPPGTQTAAQADKNAPKK